MLPPPEPFFMEGPCEDQGYLNTRDHSLGVIYKRFVEELWGRFYPLADSHFREDARNHFLERFWEMYLAVALLEHGFELYHHGDEGPEFYAILGDRRVWFEAVAPGPGDGPDKVPQPVLHEAVYVPEEKILLRFTNALAEKRGKYNAALAKGIISARDYYVLAIDSRGIPHAPYGGSMPYFIKAFLPFGPFAITVDAETFKQKDSFYTYRPEVSKVMGSSVSTSAFLEEEARFCSAVLHSAVDCANYPEKLGGDFSVLHNPHAQNPLSTATFDWCGQFTFEDGYLRPV